MRRLRGRAVALASAVGVALPTAAAGAGAVPLEAGADGGARIAVDPAGIAAAVYPGPAGVRLRVADAGARPIPVPVPRGAVVEGFAMLAGGRPAVLVREGVSCSALTLLVRESGAWRTERLGAPNAASAAITIDPAGSPVVVSGACDGAVGYRVRDAITGAWTSEDPGFEGRAGADLSVVAGPSGLALAGVAGDPAAILQRGADGGWQRLGLPFTPLAPGEVVSALQVAFDALGRPVVYIARGSRPPLDPAGGTLGGVQRSLARSENGVWRSLEFGLPDPVDLAANGFSYAVRERGGTVRLRGPAGESRVLLDALSLAVGPEGTPAFVPRTAPRVLGVGLPPTLRLDGDRRVPWGGELTVTVRVGTSGSPLAGVRVAVGPVAGATDDAGAARLSLRLTRDETIVATTAVPGPLAPATAALDVTVLPRRSRLTGVVSEGRGGRAVVRGTVAGGVPLPGRLGRVYLVDLASPGAGFLPGRELGSARGRGGFRIATRLTGESRPALFFEGAVKRLPRGG